ncbi:hypothetical protein ACJX0J_005744, partial [Zea mays]
IEVAAGHEEICASHTSFCTVQKGKHSDCIVLGLYLSEVDHGHVLVLEALHFPCGQHLISYLIDSFDGRYKFTALNCTACACQIGDVHIIWIRGRSGVEELVVLALPILYIYVEAFQNFYMRTNLLQVFGKLVEFKENVAYTELVQKLETKDCLHNINIVMRCGHTDLVNLHLKKN